MKKKICPLCRTEVPEGLYEHHLAMDKLIIQRVKKDFPDWNEHDGACAPCLKRYQALAA